jgi:outer membrane biosynthesis protein TonB
MISISDLRRAAVSLQWHEAVGVIAELAGTMQASGLAHVPDPRSIVLAADGTLLVSGGSTLEGLPSSDLAGLLEALLSSVSHPPELGRFVAGNLGDAPAHATIEAFAEALAFFERPGRRELLTAIAERATEIEGQVRADEELERLVARTRDRQEPAKDARSKGASRPRGRMLIVASVAVALALIAGAGFVAFATQPKPATIAGRVQARVKQIVQTGLEAVGATKLELPPAPVETPVEMPAPRAKRKPSPRRSRQVELKVRVNELGGVPLPDRTLSDEAALPEAPLESDATVYGVDAEGVEPAELVRPHLPSRPPHTVPAEHVGVLELVVSQTGAVDHVRLISPGNRYQDRMIVSAAKAWRFRPATKDGLPVRSRTRVRVTL